MQITRDISCCGMREIGQLSGTTTAKLAMVNFTTQTLKTNHTNFRYAVFSEANYAGRGVGRRHRYGCEFVAFIRTNKLGKVAATGWHVNPNSGNKLKAWLWTVDWDALQKWSAKKPRVRAPRSKPVTVVAGNAIAEALNARG